MQSYKRSMLYSDSCDRLLEERMAPVSGSTLHRDLTRTPMQEVVGYD